MSGHLVVAELGAWFATMALVAVGAATSAAFWWLRPRLEGLAPAARERVLVGWAALPWVVTAILTLGCYLPSFLDRFGGVPDHCSAHGGHHFHLCFQHAAGLERSAAAGALAGFVGVAGIASLLAVAVWGWRYLRLVGGLAALSEPDAAGGFLRVATRRPLAMTLGLLSPRIFVSEGLEGAVAADDLAVVLAHEGAHVRRRDGLRKLAMATFTIPFLPPLRAALLEEYAAACEECCDAEAATRVESPAHVARALVAVARLGEAGDLSLPSPACRFAPGRLERRVRALLATSWMGCGRRWAAGFALVLLGVGMGTGMAAGALHHAVETGLAIIF